MEFESAKGILSLHERNPTILGLHTCYSYWRLGKAQEYWYQWLEHRWPQVKVPGSSPGGDSQFFFRLFSFASFPQTSGHRYVLLYLPDSHSIVCSISNYTSNTCHVHEYKTKSNTHPWCNGHYTIRVHEQWKSNAVKDTLEHADNLECQHILNMHRMNSMQNTHAQSVTAV